MPQNLPNKPKTTFPANTEMGAEQSSYKILEKILQSPKLKGKDIGDLIMENKPTKGSPLYILGSYLRTFTAISSLKHLMELANTKLISFYLESPEDRSILENLANTCFSHINNNISVVIHPESLKIANSLNPDDWEKEQQLKRTIIETREQILPTPIVAQIPENNPQNSQEILQLIKLLPINPNSPVKVFMITKDRNRIQVFLKVDDTDRYENGSPKDSFNMRESAIIITIQENQEVSVQHAHILTTFTDWIIPSLRINNHLNPFTQPWGKYFFQKLKQYGIDTRNIIISQNPLEVIQGLPDYM